MQPSSASAALDLKNRVVFHPRISPTRTQRFMRIFQVRLLPLLSTTNRSKIEKGQHELSHMGITKNPLRPAKSHSGLGPHHVGDSEGRRGVDF
eukprot:2127023-Amphidinium_carterae.1